MLPTGRPQETTLLAVFSRSGDTPDWLVNLLFKLLRTTAEPLSATCTSNSALADAGSPSWWLGGTLAVVASNRLALLGGILNELITWELGIVKAMFVVSPSHYWFTMLVEDSVQGGKVCSLTPPTPQALQPAAHAPGLDGLRGA